MNPLRWGSLIIAALAVSQGVCAQESYPVVHSDPITLRVLEGAGHGAPLVHVHLTLIAGYDANDVKHQMWRETVLTNEYGEARLPRQLANLPLLQVWVQKLPLCQQQPRKDSFSVERIREYGISAPNQCGTVTADETPGLFTVFVKHKGKAALKKAAVNTKASTQKVPTVSALSALPGRSTTHAAA